MGVEPGISNWLKQADHDLEAAANNIAIKAYDVAAFLCQQAVEKYFKALYIKRHQKPAPRIHYLDQLSRMLELDGFTIDQAKELSDDYMISRYPDVTNGAPYEEYDESSAKRKLEIARGIIDRLKGVLAEHE